MGDAAGISYEGSCHCGAVGWTYTTARPPDAWKVRSCRCSFCRAHGARCTSDPRGAVRFRADGPDSWIRYRFALRTADFLICRRCGIYLGARIPAGDGAAAIVNLNALARPLEALPEATASDHDGEDAPRRIARRQRDWTPVAGDV